MNYNCALKIVAKKPLKLFVLILSLVMVSALCGCRDKEGTITIEYYSLDSAEVTKTVTINFYEEDTLVSLIEANFSNVEFGTGSNHGMIMNIEDYTQPTNAGAVDWSTYVSVLVDGEYSMYGIYDIQLVDGMVVSLKAVTSSW